MSEPLTSFERSARLFKQAEKLGCDTPTEAMIADAIQDAEFDTLKNYQIIAERHGQKVTRLNDGWQDLHDSIINLIPKQFRQNSNGADSCVGKIVKAYEKAMQENHEFRHGHRGSVLSYEPPWKAECETLQRLLEEQQTKAVILAEHALQACDEYQSDGWSVSLRQAANDFIPAVNRKWDSTVRDGYCYCDMCGFNYRQEIEDQHLCPDCKAAFLIVSDELPEHVAEDEPSGTWPPPYLK
jgi:predicted Zn-ribbon and HTH transcriptional regulator